MPLSNNERKRRRKAKGCTSKRRYRSSREAKQADSSRFPYQCKVCYGWHNTSTPSLEKINDIMSKYR